MSYPLDGDEKNPYPFYDRWGDSHNLAQEFVILHQGRGLAVSAWLMAQTPLRTQKWKPQMAQIKMQRDGDALTAQLNGAGFDLATARIVWEAEKQEPAIATTFKSATASAPRWIEAEAQLVDGRFVFASTNLTSKATTPSQTGR